MKPLKGLHVLITAGPTREYIDPVRFLSNPSTGQMGYALAEAAKARGAHVTLVSGPTNLTAARGIEVIPVVSAADMYKATVKAFKTADITVMTAAVADYRPDKSARKKLKKTGAGMTLKLLRTQDILATLGKRKKRSQLLVGFAAETQHVKRNARQKLEKKQLDMIVANHVRPDNAFGASQNEVSVLFADGSEQALSKMSKKRLAGQLFDLIQEKV